MNRLYRGASYLQLVRKTCSICQRLCKINLKGYKVTEKYEALATAWKKKKAERITKNFSEDSDNDFADTGTVLVNIGSLKILYSIQVKFKKYVAREMDEVRHWRHQQTYLRINRKDNSI